MKLKTDQIILLALTLGTTAIALVMDHKGYTTHLEAASFITGALCVWLTVKESVWNFPISLINVSTFSVVFFRAHLLADGSLQMVYFVLTLIGWYLWLYGGEKHTALVIHRASPRENLLVAVAFVVMSAVLWKVLPLLGGSAAIFDAATTSLSLCAQWLLNRKRLENWIYWIIADIIYIPMYCYKQLYLTGLLYCVFLCMASMGWVEWNRRHRAQKGAA